MSAVWQADNISVLLFPVPTTQGDDRPDGLYQSEGPCALQKAIDRAESTGSGECEDEPMAPIFKRICRQHCRDREKAEQG